MGTRVLDFDMGMVTASGYDQDGFPVAQIDAYGGKLSGAEPYQVHSPHGLITRCHDPERDDDGNINFGCNALFADEGGTGHVWYQTDPRIIPLVPQVKKGGFCAYGGRLKNPSYHYIDGDNGSTTIYVPYRIVNDVATKSMSIELNVENENEESIAIVHGSGAAITITENQGKVSTVIKNQKGDASIEINDQGVVINGQLLVLGGMSAGGQTGMPLVPAPEFIAFMTKLLTIIGSINISFTQGVAIASIASELSTLQTKFAKGV